MAASMLKHRQVVHVIAGLKPALQAKIDFALYVCVGFSIAISEKTNFLADPAVPNSNSETNAFYRRDPAVWVARPGSSVQGRRGADARTARLN